MEKSIEKKVLTLDESVTMVTEILEDMNYDLTKAKAPSKIRALKHRIKFVSSIKFHLTKLQHITKPAQTNEKN